jgi:hypothetical protein
METILFFTAFKDIGRKNFVYYTRSNETYFNYFINLAENINYKLIVYIENDIKTELLNYKNINNPNIIFKDLNYVRTFYELYNNDNNLIINSEHYKKKIPILRTKNPEHKYAEYNSITNSKFNFINNAKKIFPNYEYYAWIDFGCVRNLSIVPQNINISKLVKKIIFHCFSVPDCNNRKSEDEMLASDVIYFDGSQFIVHTSLVGKFEFLCDMKLQDWIINYITDDDQNLVLQVYYDNPELFELVINNSWYSLFNSL